MTWVLVPADVIAQGALRYLHLLQQQPLHRLVQTDSPTPAAPESTTPALSRSLTTPFSDAHLAQLSAEDIRLRPRLRRTRRTLQFRREN